MLIVKFGKTGGDGLWSHVPSTLARIAVDVLGCGYHVDVRRRSSMNEAAFDLSQWRKAARARLLAAREAVPLDERRRWNEAVTALLLQGFGGLAGRSVGFCWPYRAEPDVRVFLRAMRAQGSRCALPVVIDKKGPLEFREWWPGAERAALEIESRKFAELQGYQVDWDSIGRLDDMAFVNGIAQIAPFDAASKQALLEVDGLANRAELIIQLLQFFGRQDGDDDRVTLQ
jgi:hypothetical protein